MDLLTHTILPFVAVLMGLLIVHEAAHYATAKLFGVKVLEAGVGIPPRVWGFTWHGTIYSINALPFGAFVRMLGEEDPSDPESLAAKEKWKRTIIIGSGAFANLILAIVLFTVSLMIPHPVSAGGAQIAGVAPGSPAEQAGLQPGDQIWEVNGRRAKSTAEAAYLIRLHQGSTIDLTVKRTSPTAGSELIERQVYARWDPPAYNDECGVPHSQGPTGIQIAAVSTQPISRTPEDIARLKQLSREDFKEYKTLIAAGAPAWCYGGSAFGFSALSEAQCADLAPADQADARALRDELFAESRFPCYEFRPGPAYEVITIDESQPLWEAVPNGVRLTFESLILTRNQLWSLARGFGSSPLTGPVGIAQATGEVVDEAGWLPLITLAASISMGVAIFNFLPIPMVDGGRLVFIFIEFLRGGKRVDPQKEALVHFIGFVAMIGLFLVITWFDVARIIRGDSLLR